MHDESVTEGPHPLGFNDEWLRLEIVSTERIRELLDEYETGEDPNPEHYRWRAFVSFLDQQPTLSEAKLVSLYRLGESDPHVAMGESMMNKILQRADCPLALLEEAAASNVAHLVRIARRRLDR